MKNFWRTLAVGTAAVSLAACSSSGTSGSSANSGELSGTYSIHVEGDDWGCGVDQVVIELNKEVEGVTKDTFTVSEHKQTTDWSKEDFPVIEADFQRKVEDAYTSDASGKKVDGPSKYVTLKLYISPEDGTPLLFTMSTMMNTWSDPYELTFKVAEGQSLKADGVEIKDFTVTGIPTAKTTEADSFKATNFKSKDGYDLNYSLYTPEKESKTLFVWLHGIGEGGSAMVEGTDWMMPVLGNEVTAFAQEEFQTTVGGANVLVPQCPTYWMDTTGKQNPIEQADGTSAYTESLHELIAKVKEETKSDKVVLAGCSNGGYMAMVMAMNYGDEYDAYVPICEAVPNDKITDDQIKKLAALPMYFIWAESDTTVDPAKHEAPTVQRLKDAGAKDLQVSTTKDVHDTTGRFKDKDGNPYEYDGHWSWTYFDNNESAANDTGVKAWDWIAEKVK
ncbi:MAG: hypothetical protein HUJ54_07265 [Erysipelotrichaceae bacterium]|nr:hypothetical protein [Erysipelotrichaceae bacterium]